MKLFFSPIIIIIVLTFTSCGGQKSSLFEKEGSLVFKKSTYSNWVAGIKGGGAGYSINLVLDNPTKDVTLDTIYFKTYKKSLLENSDGLYSGFIDNGQNKEVLLPVFGGDSEVKKAPKAENTQSRFELTGNEAVISYTENGVTKYYKTTLTLDTSVQLPR